VANVDVDIDINVHNNTTVALTEITNNVTHLHQAVARQEQQNNKWNASFKKLAKSALTHARAVGKVVATVAALASVSGPAASGLLATGKAIAAMGSASMRLLPLLAFIPALVAGFGLIKLTAKIAGPGLVAAFEPIVRVFQDADGNATKFAKSLQKIIGMNVKPLAQAFVKMNMPAIGAAMARISSAVNRVVVGFGQWANSAPGVEAIRKVSEATAWFVERIGPHVEKVAIAFGNLAGRAADPAFKAFSDIIIKILDRLAAWADSTTIEDITRALSDLSGYGQRLRQVFDVIRDIGRWLKEHEAGIKHFSDVVATAAIGIGIATGAVPAVVLGAVTLIINHWNQLKAPFLAAYTWVRGVIDAWQNDAGRIKIAEAIGRAWNAAKDAFELAIKDIGPKWTMLMTKLCEAWEQWAPLITMWWNSVGKGMFEGLAFALGALVVGMLAVSIVGAAMAKGIAQAFKVMVSIVLNVFGTIINGAAMAFGWMPGIGPKLQAAAAQFNRFRDQVNAAMAGIDPLKTIRVNAQVHLTVSGDRPGAQGGPGWTALGGATSWMQAAAQFAGAAASVSRTGGPTPVTATVNNTINLDGAPFRSYTDRAVMASERRTAWRDRNRRVRPA